MRLLLCLFLVFMFSQTAGFAQAKYAAVLEAYETAEKPSSPEPARLVNKVLRDELEKGGIVHVVERKNVAPGVRLEGAPYYVGAKIDGLRLIGTKPVRVAIIMDLTKFSSRELMAVCETSINQPGKIA